MIEGDSWCSRWASYLSPTYAYAFVQHTRTVKPVMPRAESVLIGPGLRQFTRTPYGPCIVSVCVCERDWWVERIVHTTKQKDRDLSRVASRSE